MLACIINVVLLEFINLFISALLWVIGSRFRRGLGICVLGTAHGIPEAELHPTCLMSFLSMKPLRPGPPASFSGRPPIDWNYCWEQIVLVWDILQLTYINCTLSRRISSKSSAQIFWQNKFVKFCLWSLWKKTSANKNHVNGKGVL